MALMYESMDVKIQERVSTWVDTLVWISFAKLFWLITTQSNGKLIVK